MKNLLFVFGLAILLSSCSAQSGALTNLSKQSSTVAQDAQKATTAAALASLDKQLKDKFKLDGVKSSLVGDALKIQVADSDFTKLSAANQTKQGNQILDSALGILSGSGLNLKSLGINNILVELLQSLNLNTILSSIKKTL
ncbi:MAG: hypothetical protein K9H61_04535 [Bacteroidia bacterium]|nr:hypothetical protein [Bacteroidia bacterium]MCF8426214.1 hypothetical protein [Bacteroidia bacterium]MCF8446244.1 hypothetical protein [Bacteroidia bacterium]